MRTFGLIGKKLDHSFSKRFFTDLFNEKGIPAEYKNFELTDIVEVAELFQQNSFSGLNVTIPYKESILPYLDELSKEAEAIGAVNTIVFEGNKKIGHNTEAFGFGQSIKPFLTFHHERALILGTGGASKAVAYVLENLGIEVIYASRNPKNKRQFPYPEINDIMVNSCKLIVNTTPTGTFPNVKDHPEFPFHFLGEDHLVIDLIYNPALTSFLKKAQENGATILNGQAMLEQQALKAWELWEKV